MQSFCVSRKKKQCGEHKAFSPHTLSEQCFNNCIGNCINNTEGLMSAAEYPRPRLSPSQETVLVCSDCCNKMLE